MTELTSFTNDLTKEQVDWQAHLFSNTAHAFTNPQASDYHLMSTMRSWILIQTFLHELFF